MTSARTEVLRRIGAALGAAGNARPAAEPLAAARPISPMSPDRLVELFVERVTDYRATVVSSVDDALAADAAKAVVAPDLERRWWPSSVPVVIDEPPLGAAELDAPGLVVVTTCAIAIAETGTIVLDASAGQGRRVLTLVPDHHVCVVARSRIVATVPEAVARLDPWRPLTWISGPSATSDIELHRVEGVHGPRRLTVVLADD